MTEEQKIIKFLTCTKCGSDLNIGFGEDKVFIMCKECKAGYSIFSKDDFIKFLREKPLNKDKSILF